MLNLLLKTLITTLILMSSLQARDINLNTIIDNANQQDKHVFVFLHRTDCGYCESMIEFTLDDDSVKKLLDKKFVFVHINVFDEDSVSYKSFSGSGREFAIYVDYNIYPSSLFFGNDKELVYAIPGYQDEKEFLNILRYINSKSYNTEDYEDFQYGEK